MKGHMNSVLNVVWTYASGDGVRPNVDKESIFAHFMQTSFTNNPNECYIGRVPSFPLQGLQEQDFHVMNTLIMPTISTEAQKCVEYSSI